jgi:hypothetical protein
MNKESKESKENEKWYVGSMIDSLCIINRPPSPAGTDVVWEGRKEVQHIACVDLVTAGFAEASRRANLLAAAPELLAALKALRAEVPPYSLGSALLGKVDDAIEKAEGVAHGK